VCECFCEMFNAPSIKNFTNNVFGEPENCGFKLNSNTRGWINSDKCFTQGLEAELVKICNATSIRAKAYCTPRNIYIDVVAQHCHGHWRET
jgi:hypothetical protein